MFGRRYCKPVALAAIFTVLSSLCAYCEPTVTLDRAKQRYPWNGFVDLGYSISGMDDACAFDYTLEFSYRAEADGKTFSGVAATYLGRAACELVTSNGSWSVTWNAAADGLSFASTSLVVTATIRRAVTATDGDYMVIDLAPGSKAKRYPVTFLSSIADPDVTFNRDEYKTTKLVLRKVAKGDFWMGTGDNGDISSASSTRHRVRLTKDYFLGIFPVTQRQYKLVQGTNPSQFATNAVWETLPVEKVSRDVAASGSGFIANLTTRAQRGLTRVGTFKLPTQAQWEHAARGETLTRYWWGNTTDCMPACAWYNAASTGVVGSKISNPWSFYDMIGNVYEWTEDWGHGTWSGTEENPDVDPVASGGGATDRGGCWSASSPMTCGGQDASPSTYTANTHGFRISLTCE